MEINQIKSLLAKVNHCNEDPERTILIRKAEKILIEYLTEVPSDLEMWYKLVLLNLVFFHDEFEGIKHLQTIWEKFQDARAPILIAFVKDEYLGGVEESDFETLSLITTSDLRLKACTEKLISDYCINNKSESDYLKHLAKSIFLCDKYVHAYLNLGYFYKEQKDDEITAMHYFSKALSSVEKVFNEDDTRNRDYFDLTGYFNEMVYSIHCTIPKYEYIKALAEGKEIY